MVLDAKNDLITVLKELAHMETMEKTGSVQSAKPETTLLMENVIPVLQIR